MIITEALVSPYILPFLTCAVNSYKQESVMPMEGRLSSWQTPANFTFEESQTAAGHCNTPTHAVTSHEASAATPQPTPTTAS